MSNNKILTAVILDTQRSPNVRLRPVSISDIQLDPGFWQTRYLTNARITLPTQSELLESTGRLDNFRRAAGKLSKPYQGYVFNDSDVYKWLEAAAWTMVHDQNPELTIMVNMVIQLISEAQDIDGYVNTYFSVDRVSERWTNLQEKHELYCAGHLLQAAIAHHRATGDDGLMNIGLRLADHLYRKFGPGQREATSGHPEIELALVELYRTTRDERYLDLARLFIDRRGRGLVSGRDYYVDHIPFRQLEILAGHAVRALYLCAGATDLYIETGENRLLEALERLWSGMVQKQLYITGAVGSRYDGEAFGEPYELPNATAYAETCAAIASLMWNWRMFQLDGASRYADLFEWTLYNAVLPGISLDGRQYFYVNPLQAGASHRRQDWFACACCPPNIARTIAMLPGYIYSLSSEGIWVNLYASSNGTIKLYTGQKVALRQVTSYPWDGHISIQLCNVQNDQPVVGASQELGTFSLFLRLPGWLGADRASVKVNGMELEHEAKPGTYLEVRRNWKTGDTLEIDFPMPVHYLESHPSVAENSGRVTITRGPLVYCLEQVDNPGINLSDVLVDPTRQVVVEYLPALLGGVVQLQLQAFIQSMDKDWEGKLYRPWQDLPKQNGRHETVVKAVPYFTWANCQPGAMQVWHESNHIANRKRA